MADTVAYLQGVVANVLPDGLPSMMPPLSVVYKSGAEVSSSNNNNSSSSSNSSSSINSSSSNSSSSGKKSSMAALVRFSIQ